MAVLAAGLTVGLALRDSAAQAPGATSSAGGQGAAAQQEPDLVHPEVITAPEKGVPTKNVTVLTATDPSTELVETTATDETTHTTYETKVVPPPVTGTVVGNAALAKPEEKAKEQQASCASHPPGTNPLLGVGSAVSGGDDDHTLTWIFLGIGVLAAVATGGAIVARVRRTPVRPDGKKPPAAPKTPLEIAGSTVTILGFLSSIAIAYFGAGAREHPAPEVEMKVREVHSRITHGAYATKLRDVAGMTTLDRRQIGNVVWLELHFTGYSDTKLILQTTLFQPGPGEPVIPGTDTRTPIPIGDGDVHTQFLPVWVGLPRVQTFRAEFRIIDGREVRQIASTDEMKGAVYRYTC